MVLGVLQATSPWVTLLHPSFLSMCCVSTLHSTGPNMGPFGTPFLTKNNRLRSVTVSCFSRVAVSQEELPSSLWWATYKKKKKSYENPNPLSALWAVSTCSVVPPASSRYVTCDLPPQKPCWLFPSALYLPLHQLCSQWLCTEVRLERFPTFAPESFLQNWYRVCHLSFLRHPSQCKQ